MKSYKVDVALIIRALRAAYASDIVIFRAYGEDRLIITLKDQGKTRISHTPITVESMLISPKDDPVISPFTTNLLEIAPKLFYNFLGAWEEAKYEDGRFLQLIINSNC